MEQENQDEGSGILGVLGLGAASLALPSVRKKAVKGIRSLFKKKDPPVDPNTDGVPLRPVLDDTPPQEMTQEVRNLVKYDDTLQKKREEYERIRKVVEQKPLTFGGRVTDPDSYQFGSVVYDYIALHPSKKALTADQWAQDFRTAIKKGANLRYKTPGYQNVAANVTKDELSDMNLAVFDKQDRLVGGFLHAAKEANVPIDKETLFNIASKSPGANIQVTSIGLRPKTLDIYEEFDDAIREKAEGAVTFFTPAKLKALGLTKKEVDGFPRYIKAETDRLLDDLYLDYTHLIASTSSGRSANTTVYGKVPTEIGLSLLKRADRFDDRVFMDGLKNEKAKKAYQTYLSTAGKLVEDKVNDSAARLAKGISDDIFQNKHITDTPPNIAYGKEDSYRLQGSDGYQEVVVQVTTPRVGVAARSDSPSHYGSASVGTSQLKDNQLYFMRIGTRRDFENPKAKVYSINEIQSDIQQKIPKGSDIDRDNPYNVDSISGLIEARIKQVIPRIKEIVAKGMNATDAERIERRDLLQKSGSLLNKRGSMSEEKVRNKTENNFLPFGDRSLWGEHAIKVLVKKAIKDGVDYVSVNPANIQTIRKNRGDGMKAGIQEFYGMTEGISTRQAQALREGKKVSQKTPKGVLVEAMEKIAKQYGTQVQKRRISYSNPEKPHKVVQYFSPNREVKIKSGVEHRGAFKSKGEATDFRSKAGGEYVEIPGESLDNYYEAYTLPITPEMKKLPFKLYKQSGGLAVNIFKW